ncbi:MAG: hypothetical protein ACI4OS_00435 [Akkermansia sp.]
MTRRLWFDYLLRAWRKGLLLCGLLLLGILCLLFPGEGIFPHTHVRSAAVWRHALSFSPCSCIGACPTDRRISSSLSLNKAF